MKHAFLILAHNKFDQLQLLISLLDDSRFDIFLHIDKKVKLPQLQTHSSHLFFLTDRVDIKWGDISMVQAELHLFEFAQMTGQYDYYHVISGVDIPLKSNDYIYDFFEKNNGKEFLHFCDEKPYLKSRVYDYNFYTKFSQHKTFVEKFCYINLKILSILVSFFHTKSIENLEYKMGSQWASITNNFCTYLLKNKDRILYNFRYSSCADELYKQTMCWNSVFREKINFTDNDIEENLRLIDWKRGEGFSPYTWGGDLKKDCQIVNTTNCLFARKMDIERFPEMINYIVRHLR